MFNKLLEDNLKLANIKKKRNYTHQIIDQLLSLILEIQNYLE